MSGNLFVPSLVTIPVDLVYLIFDHLDELALLCSVRDVCRRMNQIVDSYSPYQVSSVLGMGMHSRYQSSRIHRMIVWRVRRSSMIDERKCSISMT